MSTKFYRFDIVEKIIADKKTYENEAGIDLFRVEFQYIEVLVGAKPREGKVQELGFHTVGLKYCRKAFANPGIPFHAPSMEIRITGK